MPPNLMPNLRPFQLSDLHALLAFVGHCYARAEGCGVPHPGDVAHAMSNSLRGRDLDQHIFLAERGGMGGDLRGVLLVAAPQDASFDVVVLPEERGSPFERALFEEGIRRTRAPFAREAPGEEAPTISIEVSDCDTSRRALVTDLGFVPDATPAYVITTRPLTDDLPAPRVPQGFTLRAVAGEHEAAAVADVHNHSFTPKWTPEEYLAVMRSPGFVVEHELVAVAEDGTFAAFVVIWLDPVSRVGEFEPVGTARAFQRRGLGTALLYEGMRQMRAAGMDQAQVVHITHNPPAEALYHSVGFLPRYISTLYRLPGTR